MAHNRRRFIKGAVAAGVAAGIPAGAATASASTPNGRKGTGPTQVGDPRPELDALLLREIERARIPGLQACVVKNGEIVWGRALGSADLRRNRKMTLRSSQIIASITKTVSTTAVLRRSQAGDLDLDRPLDDYINFKVRNPIAPRTPITLRQILTHTSSLTAYGPEPGAYGESYRLAPSRPKAADEWAELFFSPYGESYSKKFFYPFAPGREWDYGSASWALVAATLNQSTGKSLFETFDTEIAAPLRMTNSSFQFGALSEVSIPHAWVENGRKVVNSGLGPYMNLLRRPRPASLASGLKGFTGYIDYGPYGFPMYADGGLHSNALDLAAYVGMWMNGGSFGGRRVLERRTVEQALRPAIPAKLTEGFRQCLSWFRETVAGGSHLYSHDGGDLGVTTQAGFLLPERVGVVLISNIESTPKLNLNRLMRRLMSEFSGRELALESNL